MVSIDIKQEHMEQLSVASQKIGIPMQELINNIFDNFFEYRLPEILEVKEMLKKKEE